MIVKIRTENKEDFKAVSDLVRSAFAQEQLSDHKEQFLVERLRHSDAFIPELSLVAEADNQVAGYILLTRIKIKNDSGTTESLALAPVAVLQQFQGRGIGGELIRAAHKKAGALGYRSIVLLGHAHYYPRFGYERAGKYGIRLPFDAPDENCMVIGLTENALENISGMVEYPEAFFL